MMKIQKPIITEMGEALLKGYTKQLLKTNNFNSLKNLEIHILEKIEATKDEVKQARLIIKKEYQKQTWNSKTKK